MTVSLHSCFDISTITSKYLNNKLKNRAFEPFLCKGYKGRYDIYYFDFEKCVRTKKSTKTKNQAEAFRELSKFKTNFYKGNKKERMTKLEILFIFLGFKNNDFNTMP